MLSDENENYEIYKNKIEQIKREINDINNENIYGCGKQLRDVKFYISRIGSNNRRKSRMYEEINS